MQPPSYPMDVALLMHFLINILASIAFCLVASLFHRRTEKENDVVSPLIEACSWFTALIFGVCAFVSLQ